MTLIEVLAAGLMVLASALVFKELLSADRFSDVSAPAQPVIRRRRRRSETLRKAA